MKNKTHVCFLTIYLELKEQIRKVCQEEYFVCGEDEELGSPWMEKVILDYK